MHLTFALAFSLPVAAVLISRPKAGTSAPSSMAELGREVDGEGGLIKNKNEWDRTRQSLRRGRLFFSADIDGGMQRQMIRSDSSERGNAAVHADQRSLRFNPDSVERENRRARRESP
jgi:hypothetical protein